MEFRALRSLCKDNPMTDSPAPRSVDVVTQIVIKLEKAASDARNKSHYSAATRIERCIKEIGALFIPTTPAVLAKPEAIASISAGLLQCIADDGPGYSNFTNVLMTVEDCHTLLTLIRGAGEAVKTEARTPGTKTVCIRCDGDENDWAMGCCGDLNLDAGETCPIRTHKEG